jgi:C4-dicarboxylate-specific signal transduction histidine kinase
MLKLVRRRLAVRQASYAVAVIMAVASLISLVGIINLYDNERERLTKNLSQQISMVSRAASRAAFHVDEIQAATTLEGLLKFENLEWARISTNLGQVLAEQRRPVRSSFTDPLARYLFRDLVFDQRSLRFEAINQTGNSIQSGNGKITDVGIIELRASPELAGKKFLDGTITLVAALLIQFILLGVALAVVFHCTLTLPILSYAGTISKLVTVPGGMARLATPKGHECDELGMVVKRTNQLLEHIELQHQDLLHREKVATLGTLLAGVSHELNNPLSILAVQSELLVETAKDAKTRERGERILAMTNRCTVIVQRFLALARRRDVKKVPEDVGDIIREVLEILDYQMVQADVETDISISKNLPCVLADKSQITQTLLNLVINAEQSVLENAAERCISILAEFKRQEFVVQISISDNGPGIPAESLEHVFEPFYTTKREGEGTGLGLSYARDVARDHRGDLTASSCPSGGATFILTMPASLVTH